ncbi:hypothetical protein Poli38472_004879 [Pythium oligandrum]|uniref:Uncharacterized protein n=1 Tax=Pythium oligandrum TaxID=41045 RepID=A0A8K1CBL0_PYTOL|nr:hypothetical protein Poli38472_004879 [Pythium oligandrum]|eukprot:TMW59810.1 hypothetical protein Poli38472_004879 [Pythium oligandrum]
MRGVVMRHRTWVVVERTSDDFTPLKTFHIGTPQVYDATQGHQSIVCDLANFLLLALDKHLDREQRELETQALMGSRVTKV